MKSWLRKVVPLFLAVLILCTLVGCSLESLLGSTSDVSDVSDTSGASGTEGEDTEPERPLLAEEGTGLYQPPSDPMAEAVCIVNEETGLVVYEKNSDTSMAAASMVKMMTCILVMDQAEKFGWDLDTTMVDSTDQTWIYNELSGINASTADIYKGEVLSLRELLYGTLVPSGNEAAMLLANFVCTGYMENFYYMMNTRARNLGCTGTYFSDVTGLSEESVTTARDMARITSAFMSYPVLVEIASTSTYTMAAHEKHSSEYNIFSTNRLLVESSPYYSALGAAKGTIVAGKTGSLGEWQNFAALATKNGESYVCVVMHSPNEADSVYLTLDTENITTRRPALVETATLLNWVFTTFTVTSPLDVTQPVTELRVQFCAETDTVRLMPTNDIKAVLPIENGLVTPRRVYSLPQSVPAPVEEGQEMGEVILYIGQHAIGTSTLVSARSVERNQVMYMMAQVGDFFTGTYFRVLVMLVLGCGVIYALGFVLLANSRSRKRKTAGGQPTSGRSSKGGKDSSGKGRPTSSKSTRGGSTSSKQGPRTGQQGGRATTHKRDGRAQPTSSSGTRNSARNSSQDKAVKLYVGERRPPGTHTDETPHRRHNT